MPAAIQVKVIKPQRFKDAAFKRAIQSAAKAAASEMEKDFKATVATWSSKPKFEKIVAVDPNVEVLVGTDDKVYGYVNDGTRPHLIFPKRAKALSFRWGGKGSYKPKTKPRFIGSLPGGATGPRIARPYVQHPGTKAREFDKTIEKKWRSAFKRRMEQAMGKAAKASGHGIP